MTIEAQFNRNPSPWKAIDNRYVQLDETSITGLPAGENRYAQLSYMVNGGTTKLADTSADGINSYALTTGGGWVGNVFTGAGEQNDYTYVGINLQVDEAGTLTFEFSQDGVNWSKYPVTEFIVASGINEVHGAWKGTRWVRPKFTGSDGSRTFFRLRTMYSDVPIQLTAPLNQSINGDQDATITRAVSIGETPDGSYENVKSGGIAFSTTANLTAGEVFQTEVLDLQGYTQVETHIQTDAEGVLTFEFLSDPSTVVRTLNVPYTPPAFRTFGAPAFTPYVRYSFTATTSSDGFYYDTKFTTTSINGQILALEDFISPTMVANLGRNVIVAKKPGNNNLYANVATDSENNLSVSVPKTAFGELKVAEITPTIQASFPYTTINSRVWTQGLSGTSDIASVNSTVSVSAGGANSYAKLNSVRSNKYRPGQGGLVRFTALFTTPSDGSTQEIGLGDEADGFFFCTSGDQYGVNRRRGGVDNITLQSDWELDPADGTRVLPALDFTLGNVFEIEYQWLGYGAITFKVEEPTTGDFVPVHRDEYAGREALPSVFNPTLPLRIYTENTTNTTPVVVKSSSMFAGVEGKIEITGPDFARSNTNDHTVSTETFMASIENKATYSGTTNRVPIYVNRVNGTNASSNQNATVRLYKNSGGREGITYTDVDADSVVQSATGAGTFSGTANLSALSIAYTIPAEQGISIPLDNTILFPGDSIVVTSELDGNGTTASTISLNWQEDF